jgi:hypothetical protein
MILETVSKEDARQGAAAGVLVGISSEESPAEIGQPAGRVCLLCGGEGVLCGERDGWSCRRRCAGSSTLIQQTTVSGDPDPSRQAVRRVWELGDSPRHFHTGGRSVPWTTWKSWTKRWIGS